MRTVIFFGLMCIARSIGEQTGWRVSETTASWGAVIFIFAIIFDSVETILRIGTRLWIKR